MRRHIANDPANEQALAIAEQFVRARLQAVPLDCYPGELPADLAAAYACQVNAIERWPDRIAGWKVARIAAEWRDRYTDERLLGPIFASNVHRATASQAVECSFYAGGFAAIETEIGVYIASDAPADRFDWTSAEALPFIGELRIGVELASSPLATLNDLGPGAVVSDLGNNAGVIVGPTIRDWTAERQVRCETLIDGKSVGLKTIALPSAALDAVAFALGKCARLGYPLKRGDYLSTGAITGMHEIRCGEEARITFGELGEIRCRAIARQPLTE